MEHIGFFTKALLGVLLLFIGSEALNAQVKKFGEISPDEFGSYPEEYDSTSSAVVLFERGEIEFDSDYTCYMRYHRRIKIITDEGFDNGNIEVVMRRDYDQNVKEIKAATYHLSENGEIEEFEMDKDQILESDYNEDVRLSKFTLPALKTGAIIEYSYRKRYGSPFMLPDWTFHDEIPVMWSEYEMELPLTLNYRLIFRGDSLDQNEVSKSKYWGGDAQTIYLLRKDLPPVEDLPYLINRDDHISEVKTQLIGTRIPGRMPQNFFKSWDDIAEEVNAREDFGRQRLNGTMKDKVNELISDDMDELTKIITLYDFVSEEINWDGYYGVITEQGIRDTYKNKSGNVADINLMLVEMLKEAGINASPALVSTRSNGTVLLDYPLVGQFNVTLAVVELEQTAFILDASLGKRSYRFSHPRNLYRNAFVIRDDDSFGWLLTLPLEDSMARTNMSYTISDSGRVDVTMMGRLKGAYAVSVRSKTEGDFPEKYWEEELSDLKGLEVDSASFGAFEDHNEPLTYMTHFSYDLNEGVNNDESVIYLNPLLFLKDEESPFKKPTRKFPVEFNYPYSEQLRVQIQIPEGYEVDEVPEAVQYVLPNNGGFFRYMLSVQGYMVSVMSHIDIKGVSYTPEEYEAIRTIFQKKVDAENAMIVLKKVNSSD